MKTSMHHRTLLATSACIAITATMLSASVFAANTPATIEHQETYVSRPLVTTIKTGSYVEVDYVGTLSDGTVFDTSIAAVAKKANTYSESRSYKPLQTVIGQHQLIAGFERALMGMKKGQKKTFTLAPRDAYGEIDPSKREIINRSYFDESLVTPIVGNTYGLKGVAMKLIELSGDLATLDRNHPLAGKTLTFSIQIKEISHLTPVPANAQYFPQGVMSKRQLIALQKQTQGSTKANITIIEYSDLECPYCVRQYKDGIIASIMKDFPQHISYAYRPVANDGHPNSAYKASATICAGTVGGDAAFRATYQGILGGSTPNKLIDTGSVLAIVKATGIDMKKWTSCMTPEKDEKPTEGRSPASASAKKIYLQNGKEFAQWIDGGGTPSTLIVNNKNRQRILVEGAYGLDVFEGIIQMWTKK